MLCIALNRKELVKLMFKPAGPQMHQESDFGTRLGYVVEVRKNILDAISAPQGDDYQADP